MSGRTRSAEPWGHRIGALAPASYDPATGAAARVGADLDAADLAPLRWRIVGELPPGAAPFTNLMETEGGAYYLAELRPLQRV